MRERNRQSETENEEGVFRRGLLQTAGVIAGAATFGVGPSAAMSRGRGKGKAKAKGRRDDDSVLSSAERIEERVKNELKRRKHYSEYQLDETADMSAHESNPRLTNQAVVAKFGKSLPHDDQSGLPTTDGYDALVVATETGGENTAYPDIPQAYEDAERLPDDVDLNTELVDGGTLNSKPLVQPETAWTYQAEGGSTAQLRIAVPPAFDDPETGAEMVELYWRALTRDVNFRDYQSSDIVGAAAAELDELDAYNGPGADSTVTPDNVFRGVVPGTTTGPYVSQFLWKDRNLGGGTEGQKIEPQDDVNTPADYMTSVRDWKKIQNGVVPPVDNNLPGNEYSSERRYIITGRDMCERVHDDPPFRQVQKAAQVLIFTMNAPLDEGIPYSLKPFAKPSESRRDIDSFARQTTLPFNDFGPLYVEKRVLGATEQGQKAAWHKKWNVHRRLRPEEYGGRVEAVKGTQLAPKGYSRADIPDCLLDSEALAKTKEEYGTYLLPQAYAEGCPTHPSYPAGHSVVAGAGVTVLKALFDGDYVFPADEKVVPTRDGSTLRNATETNALGVDETLTVRSELNKLAANMALGRNRGGIHYRTDGIEGLRLGEAAAIRYLEDRLSLPERVPGAGGIALSFQTFDGEEVTVEAAVEPTGSSS